MARATRPQALIPLGDCAVYIEFSRTLDLEVNALVQRLARAVHARALPWLRDVVPALGGLALHFDPDHEALGGKPLESAVALVEECLKQGLPKEGGAARTIEVPVCYEPQYAADLDEVAKLTRVPAAEIGALHSAREHRVLMIGFAPGHAYMGGLDPKLAVPRRSSPRPVVAAGSVAIANEQTVIYPYAISGGWSIIGCTPLKVFDAERAEPSLFAPGDRVRFRPISRAEFERLAAA
ncbi:MAG TPA: 5-oxoprolinase subunit PxpB [Burkholderiales bacterium]